MNNAANTEVSALQKLLQYVTRGAAAVSDRLRAEGGEIPADFDLFLAENLTLASPETNYDPARITARITETIDKKRELYLKLADGTGPMFSPTWKISPASGP